MSVTSWYPVTVHPVRDGWYHVNGEQLLHWDTHTQTWGIWFRNRPGVRFVVPVDPDWKWRGQAEP